MSARIAVIYYSSTAHVHQLAEALADGAEEAGAEVRLRRAAELAPESAIRENDAWWEHYTAIRGRVAEASLDDVEWATGYAFGTPARYGMVCSQLKQFLDQLAPLWLAGKLKDKAGTAFTSSERDHGGQESTLLGLNTMYYHWGTVIVPPDTTDETIVDAGANPYGISYTTGGRTRDAIPDVHLAAARIQGARLADFTARIAAGPAAVRDR